MTDLFALLVLAILVAAWLTFSRARECAIAEVHRRCEQRGLQLLDETVGLRGLRLTRANGHLGWERRYGFEVSTTGDDRLAGQVSMAGDRVTGLSLPATPVDVAPRVDADSTVVPFRRPERPTLH